MRPPSPHGERPHSGGRPPSPHPKKAEQRPPSPGHVGREGQSGYSTRASSPYDSRNGSPAGGRGNSPARTGQPLPSSKHGIRRVVVSLEKPHNPKDSAMYRLLKLVKYGQLPPSDKDAISLYTLPFKPSAAPVL